VRARGAGLLVLASGIGLAMAFPEPDIAPVAWVALVPLLLLAGSSRPLRATGLGLLFGLGFFGSLLFWISLVGWIAWALLVLLQALFVAVFALLWSLAAPGGGAAWRVVVPPLLWVAMEYARSVLPLGGFTWGQLAQSQHNLPWMLRPAAWGGGFFVALLVVVVNAALAEGVRAVTSGSRGSLAAAALVAVSAVAAPLLVPATSITGRPLRAAIVQGNVPRHFEGSVFAKELEIIRSHERLTERLASARPDLVVWPESSLGLDLETTPRAAAAVRRAARRVDAPLIVGGNLDVGTKRYLVMAFEVSPRGTVVDRYQKTHLVPFGEYVPARSLLDWIPVLDQVPRDAIAGSAPVVFKVAGGRVAPVISYEGDFGSLVRERIAAGGRLLVVATNTSTWGRTWASAQHVAFSQVRAAENGVWVVHAALSGISAFIDPRGEVRARTPLWRATSEVKGVRFASHISFYARTGDWLPLVCVAASAVATGIGALKRADGGVS
jgi:apolipoprotein N-acyltransferase